MRLHVKLLIAMMLFSAPAFADAWSSELALTPEKSEQLQTLRMRFEVTNQTASPVRGATLATYLPMAVGPNQRLVKVEASSDARLLKKGDERALEVRLPDIGPHGSAVVTVTAHVAVQSKTRALPRPGRWATAAEALIEVDDPAIMKQAGALVRKTTAETARAIYDLVWQRVRYKGYTARDKGAKQALSTRVGDCSEMAYLFVALARAAGIPARYMGGYVTDSSALLVPHGYHNWAQWYDGRTWRIADPQKRAFDDASATFIATNAGGSAGPALVAGAHRYRVDAPSLRARMLGGR
ncbi:MAG: hypothetical protein ACI9OJ_003255 [Myxococcota bacterium]|jgi:hypothetical protein